MNIAYVACLFGALWVAVGFYRGRHPWRFLAARVAGACFAHLGWLALHAPDLADPQRALLDLTAGYSVLLFPLGPMLFSRGDPEAWGVLPLALAVARVGCLASGCCWGPEASWGSQPTPIYEIVLLALLFVLLRRVPRESAGWLFLLSFGVVRLLIEPLRTPSATLVSPALVASGWIVVGLVWALARRRRFTPGLSMRDREMLRRLYESPTGIRVPGARRA